MHLRPLTLASSWRLLPVRFAALCALLLLSGPIRAANASPAILASEFIYEQAPYPSCHASTLAEAAPGQLVVAWFGGTAEKNPDVGIWVARRENGHWTESVEVADGRQPDGTRHPTWNPVLFQPREGPLSLYYKVGPSPQTWWGMVITSPDRGRTWSAPERLPSNMLGPIKNKPVELAQGRVLFPTSIETPTRPSKWRVYFERTLKGSDRWTATPFLNDGLELSAIQPSILVHGAEVLQAVGRTRQGRVFSVWSRDGGRTWGAMTLTSLPNPNSGTDAVTLRDGRHLIVYNHTEKGRTPLNVALSRDGEAWTPGPVLESEPGEYSYPAVIQAADGRVHITYTWKRQRIKHVVLDPQRL